MKQRGREVRERKAQRRKELEAEKARRRERRERFQKYINTPITELT